MNQPTARPISPSRTLYYVSPTPADTAVMLPVVTQQLPAATEADTPAAAPHPVDVRSPRGPGRRRPPAVVESRWSAARWIGVGFLIAAGAGLAAAWIWAAVRG